MATVNCPICGFILITIVSGTGTYLVCGVCRYSEKIS